MVTTADAQNPYLTVEDRGTDPAVPPAGYARPFVKSGGLYLELDDATVIGPMGITGSALTRSQKGTTSAGGSFDSTPKTIYKKITLAAAGEIASVAVHVKGNSSGNAFLGAYVMDDNSGTPQRVIATSVPTRAGANASIGSIGVMSSTARWVQIPVGGWFPAGDYWLVVIMNGNTGTDCQVAYDSGTGSDRTKSTTDGPYDHAAGASSTGTNDYSIYANVLS